MNKRGEPILCRELSNIYKKKEPAFKAHHQKTMQDKEEEVTCEDGVPSI